MSAHDAVLIAQRPELQSLERLTDLVTADYLEYYALLPLALSPGRVTLAPPPEAS